MANVLGSAGGGLVQSVVVFVLMGVDGGGTVSARVIAAVVSGIGAVGAAWIPLLRGIDHTQLTPRKHPFVLGLAVFVYVAAMIPALIVSGA